MSNPVAKRRIVLPEKRTQAQLSISPYEVSVDSILEDAMQTAAMEVAQYRVKAGMGKLLDAKEARILQGYIETMVKLKKEQRDSDRESDLNKLSQEELLVLAKKVLNEGSTIIVSEADQDDESTD